MIPSSNLAQSSPWNFLACLARATRIAESSGACVLCLLANLLGVAGFGVAGTTTSSTPVSKAASSASYLALILSISLGLTVLLKNSKASSLVSNSPLRTLENLNPEEVLDFKETVTL